MVNYREITYRHFDFWSFSNFAIYTFLCYDLDVTVTQKRRPDFISSLLDSDYLSWLSINTRGTPEILIFDILK